MRWLVFLALLLPLKGFTLIPPQVIFELPETPISQRPYFKIEQIVPLNIEEGASPVQVERRILDHTMSHYVYYKLHEGNFSLFRAAQQIQQSLSTKLAIEGTQEGEVAHEFGFYIQAFQRIAQIDYQGFFSAKLKYDGSNQSVQLELSQEVLESTTFVYNFVHQSVEEQSTFGVRWRW